MTVRHSAYIRLNTHTHTLPQGSISGYRGGVPYAVVYRTPTIPCCHVSIPTITPWMRSFKFDSTHSTLFVLFSLSQLRHQSIKYLFQPFTFVFVRAKICNVTVTAAKNRPYNQDRAFHSPIKNYVSRAHFNESLFRPHCLTHCATLSIFSCGASMTFDFNPNAASLRSACA